MYQCVSCWMRFEVKSSDRKYLLSNTPFVCSADCTFAWITGHEPVAQKAYEGTVVRPPFRSDFERRFFEWAESRGLEVYYESASFDLGRHGSYTPDFFFPKYDCYVETKGRWMASQKTKFKRFLAEFPDTEILVVSWLIEDDFQKE
jgi:hypothetical protein